MEGNVPAKQQSGESQSIRCKSTFGNLWSYLGLTVPLRNLVVLILLIWRRCYFEYFDAHNPNDRPNEQQMKMRKKAQAESPQGYISGRQPTCLIGFICYHNSKKKRGNLEKRHDGPSVRFSVFEILISHCVWNTKQPDYLYHRKEQKENDSQLVTGLGDNHFNTFCPKNITVIASWPSVPRLLFEQRVDLPPCTFAHATKKSCDAPRPGCSGTASAGNHCDQHRGPPSTQTRPGQG